MTDEPIAAVCGEAKAQGMRAVVHLYPCDTARKVILPVCTGVEHGTFLDDAALQLMHDRAASSSIPSRLATVESSCHAVRDSQGAAIAVQVRVSAHRVPKPNSTRPNAFGCAGV